MDTGLSIYMDIMCIEMMFYTYMGVSPIMNDVSCGVRSWLAIPDHNNATCKGVLPGDLFIVLRTNYFGYESGAGIWSTPCDSWGYLYIQLQW